MGEFERGYFGPSQELLERGRTFVKTVSEKLSTKIGFSGGYIQNNETTVEAIWNLENGVRWHFKCDGITAVYNRIQ